MVAVVGVGRRGSGGGISQKGTQIKPSSPLWETVVEFSKSIGPIALFQISKRIGDKSIWWLISVVIGNFSDRGGDLVILRRQHRSFFSPT